MPEIFLRLPALALLAPLCVGAHAAPDAWSDACFVRPEALPANIKPDQGPAQSYVGFRRKTQLLFDVELSVVGPNASVCSVSGVARLRSGPEGEFLVFPVRPDAGATGKRGAMPCLVSIRSSASAIDVTNTEAACQAQALCGGQVRLQGQRFEPGTRLAAGTRWPCFARSTP